MVSELDIWRAANLLIRSHSADADLEAARLQDVMFTAAMTRGGLCGSGPGVRSRRYRFRPSASRIDGNPPGQSFNPPLEFFEGQSGKPLPQGG
jgi:hypothetical protein